MNNDELRFIDRLFKDLYKDPQVQHHSNNKGTDKYNIIDSYISSLEIVHKRAMEKEWRIEYLKSLYHNKYVIKKEDIPDYMIIPTEFYNLNDYDIKIKLLEQALRENIRLEQTETLRQMHIANLDLRIE